MAAAVLHFGTALYINCDLSDWFLVWEESAVTVHCRYITRITNTVTTLLLDVIWALDPFTGMVVSTLQIVKMFCETCLVKFVVFYLILHAYEGDGVSGHSLYWNYISVRFVFECYFLRYKHFHIDFFEYYTNHLTRIELRHGFTLNRFVTIRSCQ